MYNISRSMFALWTVDSFCHCPISLCPVAVRPDLWAVSDILASFPVPLSSLLHILPRLVTSAHTLLPACLGEHSTLSVSFDMDHIKTIDR